MEFNRARKVAIIVFIPIKQRVLYLMQIAYFFRPREIGLLHASAYQSPFFSRAVRIGVSLLVRQQIFQNCWCLSIFIVKTDGQQNVPTFATLSSKKALLSFTEVCKGEGLTSCL